MACHHPAAAAAVYTQQTNCFAREKKNIRATSQKMGERRLMSRAITYIDVRRERERDVGQGKCKHVGCVIFIYFTLASEIFIC